MIFHLISLKEHINTVLDKQGWDTLTKCQWKQLSAIQDLLQPFAHHTCIASSEDSTSICIVIPI